MTPERFSRTSILLGNEATEKLASSSVVVCGVGAVGSFAVEALARLGIGKFFLWDFDSVEESNINRQLCALDSTIGKEKTEVVRSRILDINPNANVQTYGKITPDAANIVASQGDIIVDAIDTISEKINLIFAAEERGVKIVSSMGAARRVDISKIKVADIMKTYGCPVASSIRKALRAGKYKGKCKCVFSDEQLSKDTHIADCGKKTIGSYVAVAGVFGLTLADLAVREILTKK